MIVRAAQNRPENSDSMAGMGMFPRSMGRLGALKNMTKYMEEHGGKMNYTDMLHELNHMEKDITHEAAYASPKWLMIFLGILLVFVCGVLGFLLRDEYRQVRAHARAAHESG